MIGHGGRRNARQAARVAPSGPWRNWSELGASGTPEKNTVAPNVPRHGHGHRHRHRHEMIIRIRVVELLASLVVATLAVDVIIGIFKTRHRRH